MKSQTGNSGHIGERATRNSLYSMGVNSWYLLSRFLLTPVILHYLPLKEYGLWSLCFVVMSFLALGSIGIEATYIKYVARFHARGETERTNRLLSTGLFMTCGFASLVLAALWVGLPHIFTVLKIEPALVPKATVVFMATGVIFMLDITFNCFARALDGYQYLELTAKIRFWSSCMELVLIVVFLLLGFGIYGLTAAFLIRYLMAILVNVVYAYKHIPRLKISPAFIEMPSLKILLTYGGKMQLLSLMGILLATIDRLIITSLLGLAATGLYEIGKKIPNKGGRIPSEISGALMPALSHLQAKDDMGSARNIFLLGSRYMAMLSAPLFTFFALSAPYAIYVWLGQGYGGAVSVMVIISAAAMVHLLTGPSSALARGIGRLDWELKCTALNILLSLIFTPLGAVFFGLAGAAAGVSAGNVLSSLYFLSKTHGFLKLSFAEYCHKVLHPVILSVVSACCLSFVLPHLFSFSENRIIMMVLLAAVGVIHLCFSAFLLALTGGVTAEEKVWLKKNAAVRQWFGRQPDNVNIRRRP